MLSYFLLLVIIIFNMGSIMDIVYTCSAPVFLVIASICFIWKIVGLPFSELVAQNWGSGWAQDSDLAN